MTYPADVPNIALIGKAGAGKDTVAAVLGERFRLGYQRIALADPLKNIAAILWGEEARTDRTKLQQLGVSVRDIQQDTWVNLLLRTMRQRTMARPEGADVPRWVVTDVRFPNELTALKAAGFVAVRVCADYRLRVDRLRANGKLQDESQLSHESETALDDATTDFVVYNNADHEHLTAQLVRILNRRVA